MTLDLRKLRKLKKNDSLDEGLTQNWPCVRRFTGCKSQHAILQAVAKKQDFWRFKKAPSNKLIFIAGFTPYNYTPITRLTLGDNHGGWV
jgi:hypothetical protein